MYFQFYNTESDPKLAEQLTNHLKTFAGVFPLPTRSEDPHASLDEQESTDKEIALLSQKMCGDLIPYSDDGDIFYSCLQIAAREGPWTEKDWPNCDDAENVLTPVVFATPEVKSACYRCARLWVLGVRQEPDAKAAGATLPLSRETTLGEALPRLIKKFFCQDYGGVAENCILVEDETLCSTCSLFKQLGWDGVVEDEEEADDE